MFEVVGHGVLGQERGLQADFGADPFAFAVRLIWGVIAAAAAAELRAEVRGLDLIEVLQFAPGLVTYRAGDVDLEFQNGHRVFSPQRHRVTGKTKSV